MSKSVQVLLASDPGAERALSAHVPADWQVARCSIEELLDRLDTGHSVIGDVVVVDTAGPAALSIAKRLAEGGERVQALFLLPPKQLATFRWAIALNPALGSPLAMEADLSDANVAATLREAFDTFRYDAAMRAAVENINRGVASRNAVALAKIQRQRASDRYLANLLAQIPDPIVSTDLSGAVISWNDAAAAVFQTELDAAVGRPFASFFGAAAAARVESLFSVIDARSGTLHEELVLPQADTEMHFDARFVRTVSASGEAEGVLVIMRDITALRVAQNRLEAQTHELERSNADLEQFAYVASHDLKEPLRTVGSYSQLLTRRFSAQVGADAAEFVGYITDGVQRMNDLLDDLLDYARIGARELILTRADMGDIVKQACANVAAAIAESEAQIDWAGLPSLYVDYGQLVRVMQNLISNAIKFRRDLAPLVRIDAHATQAGWTFSIADNGIGIEQEYFDYIFIAFKRLHSHESYPGSGVGLAICKKIIERHGGSMWLESEVGRGTTFYFSLPHRDG